MASRRPKSNGDLKAVTFELEQQSTIPNNAGARVDSEPAEPAPTLAFSADEPLGGGEEAAEEFDADGYAYEEEDYEDVDDGREADKQGIPLVVARAGRKLTPGERKRIERRRRAARGSALYRYFAARLHLAVMLNSGRTTFFTVATMMACLAIWLVLIFGRPDKPGYWSNSAATLGNPLPVNDSHCEQPRLNSFTRLPYSALGSLSYMLASAFVTNLWLADTNRSFSFEARLGNLPASLLVRQPGWSFLVSLTLAFEGAATWLRHASNLDVPARLETTSYWCILFCFTTMSIARMCDPPRKLRSRRFSIISRFMNGFFILVVVGVDITVGIRLEGLKINHLSEIVFGSMCGIMLLSVAIHYYLHRLTIQSELWLLVLAAMTFSAGYALVYYKSLACTGPRSVFQPYGMWHVFNALTALILYFFFRSDMWVHGDGVDTTPSLRPDRWLMQFGRFLKRLALDTCLTPEQRARERKKRPRTVSGRVLTRNKDGRLVDGDGRVVEPTRLKTFKSLGTNIVTPERGCTQSQIRTIEFIVGVVVLGGVGGVVWLALDGPR